MADLVTDYNEEHNGLVTALKYPVHVEHNPNDDEDKDSDDDDDDDDEGKALVMIMMIIGKRQIT